jgi:hypothetical protein
MKTEGKDFTHFAKAFNEIQELRELIKDLRMKVRECKIIVFKHCNASTDEGENNQQFNELHAYVKDQTSIVNIVGSCCDFEDQLNEYADKCNTLSDQLFDTKNGLTCKDVSRECRETILKLKAFGVLVRSLHLAMMQFIGLQLDHDDQFSTLCKAFDVVVQDMHNGNKKADVFVGQFKAYMLDWVYQTGYFDGNEVR